MEEFLSLFENDKIAFDVKQLLKIFFDENENWDVSFVTSNEERLMSFFKRKLESLIKLLEEYKGPVRFVNEQKLFVIHPDIEAIFFNIKLIVLIISTLAVCNEALANILKNEGPFLDFLLHHLSQETLFEDSFTSNLISELRKFEYGKEENKTDFKFLLRLLKSLK